MFPTPQIFSEKSYDKWYVAAIEVADGRWLGKPKIACDNIVAAAIALLSDQDIQSMTRDDILDTIAAARNVPRSPINAEDLSDLDDEHLQQVLCHVRRWMRRQINERSKENGWSPFFQDRFLK